VVGWWWAGVSRGEGGSGRRCVRGSGWAGEKMGYSGGGLGRQQAVVC